MKTIDPGPWTVGRDNSGRRFVESHHFKHDVRLIINGDFAIDDDEYHYAQDLARKLNIVGALSSDLEFLGFATPTDNSLIYPNETACMRAAETTEGIRRIYASGRPEAIDVNDL